MMFRISEEMMRFGYEALDCIFERMNMEPRFVMQPTEVIAG